MSNVWRNVLTKIWGVAGDFVGCNSEGGLYKGLVCFMIVGLKNFISYVIKSSSETKINANWVKEEFIDCLGVLSQSLLKL